MQYYNKNGTGETPKRKRGRPRKVKKPEIIKRPMAGQPAKYESPKLMDNLIYEYFNIYCIPSKSLITGKYVHNPPTWQGLAEFLGFASIRSLSQYRKRSNEFKKVIEKAKLKMADFLLKGMLNGELNPKAVQFILTQNYHGFTYKSEIEVSNSPDRKFEIEFIKEAKKEIVKKQNCIKIPITDNENGDYIDV